ncbi:hypothetical protein BT93_L0695 [Corymbia citriodora subsp. variegata]|uniref:Transferrin-like domain-containing protein n=1 Tax=Corymbia citriodora subsp. variegata TaxID=360336 RepID=A0A8T0CTQ7_CORYI|nr:hypothetical protein BT93_L0695 [Corymbia citriodora subsp. variegata]
MPFDDQPLTSRMQISSLFSLFIFFSSSSLAYASVIHDFAPTPEPSSSASPIAPPEREPFPDDGFGFASADYSPPAPPRWSSKHPSPLPAPALAPTEQSSPSPALVEGPTSGSADEDSGKSSSPAAAVAESEETNFHCIYSEKPSVVRDSIDECLDSIRKGEADIINLEAGAAYAAFLNSSMKAIANEVYCNRAESYDAVAIVPRKSCDAKRGLSLMDFRGRRSCHGGYSSASGWTYPIDHIKKLVGSDKMDDVDVAASFFSKVCAPSGSGLGGRGICSGCGDGDKNGTSCHRDSFYYGDEGAFRCLMEGLGDVAFARGDTALLYSMEGPYNQSWSERSGGCREINGYPGDCSFGAVPANMIMASNSIQNHKRLHVLERLSNSSWIEAAYAERISSIHMVTPSTQEFTQIKMLTRSYLGRSASISQSIQHLKTQRAEGSASGADSFPADNITQRAPGPYKKPRGHDRFGTVLANMIMASNLIQDYKRLHILERLANSSWIEAACAERISSIHVVSSSCCNYIIPNARHFLSAALRSLNGSRRSRGHISGNQPPFSEHTTSEDLESRGLPLQRKLIPGEGATAIDGEVCGCGVGSGDAHLSGGLRDARDSREPGAGPRDSRCRRKPPCRDHHPVQPTGLLQQVQGGVRGQTHPGYLPGLADW